MSTNLLLYLKETRAGCFQQASTSGNAFCLGSDALARGGWVRGNVVKTYIEVIFFCTLSVQKTTLINMARYAVAHLWSGVKEA